MTDRSQRGQSRTRLWEYKKFPLCIPGARVLGSPEGTLETAPDVAMHASYQDLNDRTVLITGGANGIGAAMVRLFAAQGCDVRFCDVDAAAGSHLANTVSRTMFAQVDLRDPGQIAGWIESTDSIAVLVNNAALDPRIPLSDLSVEAWDDLLAINLRAHMLTVQAALPRFQSPASVINFSSVTFHLGPPDMAAYVASKGGILALTRSLARELGPRGIRVNTISPGWVMTERQQRDYVTDEVRAMLRARQCQPAFLEPEEIARVALFLASTASSALTGQELLADRGWFHA